MARRLRNHLRQRQRRPVEAAEGEVLAGRHVADAGVVQRHLRQDVEVVAADLVAAGAVAPRRGRGRGRRRGRAARPAPAPARAGRCPRRRRCRRSRAAGPSSDRPRSAGTPVSSSARQLVDRPGAARAAHRPAPSARAACSGSVAVPIIISAMRLGVRSLTVPFAGQPAVAQHRHLVAEAPSLRGTCA